MALQEQLKEILQTVESGKQAKLELSIDGQTYTRLFRPKERLILLGGGTIAQPLCTYAADLGFSVAVADDRPSFANHPRFPEADVVICDRFPQAIEALNITARDYVAVITRGHRYDADCLRQILKGAFPHYLGMIGSKRRTIALLDLLEQEGYPREQLDKINTPIGLSIGALTVKEIAISIVAQLIQHRRKDTDRRAKSSILTTEDIDLNTLRTAASDEQPKALMLVYETSGSTPVKAGAYMTVDIDTRISGTIGGGCSEGAVLRDAFHLIGTGETKTMTVDMSNEVAEDEGMVCGGQMKVLIADLSAKK